jgi:hypothetical protein
MDPLARTIEILERTPSVLRAMVGGVSGWWTAEGYGLGTWSAAEVVGHLIVAEREDWMPRLRRIMEHGERVPFDPFPHDATVPGAAEAAREGRLGSLVEEFASLRESSLRDLAGMNLSAEDLARAGTHPALGRVTATQLLATWAVHDLHHLRQIGLAMAWQARGAVGPWRAYLNTLKR